MRVNERRPADGERYLLPRPARGDEGEDEDEDEVVEEGLARAVASVRGVMQRLPRARRRKTHRARHAAARNWAEDVRTGRVKKTHSQDTRC